MRYQVISSVLLASCFNVQSQSVYPVSCISDRWSELRAKLDAGGILSADEDAFRFREMSRQLSSAVVTPTRWIVGQPVPFRISNINWLSVSKDSYRLEVTPVSKSDGPFVLDPVPNLLITPFRPPQPEYQLEQGLAGPLSESGVVEFDVVLKKHTKPDTLEEIFRARQVCMVSTAKSWDEIIRPAAASENEKLTSQIRSANFSLITTDGGVYLKVSNISDNLSVSRGMSTGVRLVLLSEGVPIAEARCILNDTNYLDCNSGIFWQYGRHDVRRSLVRLHDLVDRSVVQTALRRKKDISIEISGSAPVSALNFGATHFWDGRVRCIANVE